ncbi:hypothetical protein ABW21_db0206633 [Orbilia brochopaga]|nr:hypothetical protein ABW21_db0206633 [Drechslerella brochopaga]
MASNGVSPATRHLPSRTFDTAIEDALTNNTPLLSVALLLQSTPDHPVSNIADSLPYRSWRSALYRLTTPSRSAVAAWNLKNWLLSSPQLFSLTGSYAAIPPANATSKQAFETKTSMINITADTVLPVAEMKGDALELAKALDLDELEALRVCILEYQERSHALPANFGDPVDPAPASLTMSMFARSTTKSRTVSSRPDSPEELARKARQARQVRLYFSERRYKLKVATALARIVVEHDYTSPRKTPFYAVAAKIVRKMVGDGKQDPKKGFVETLIKDIGQAITSSKLPKYYTVSKSPNDLIKLREEWERQVGYITR